MKLWLLRPVNGDEEVGAWYPWYDCTFGFVVRAETEGEARAIAHEHAGSENTNKKTYRNTEMPWLDPDQSTCEVLNTEGPSGLIIEDYHRA